MDLINAWLGVCQQYMIIAMQWLNGHPAIRASNGMTNVYSSLLANNQ
jgi:hypothetical protein